MDVAPLLAHAGGWDELLIAALVALSFAGSGFLRRRREAAARPGREAAARPRGGPCAYCGEMLQETDHRCPRCGFRARAEAAP
ncbi:MAG TPA: hypothetical protein VNP94_07190 [Actinomycetota bacterium]|nr:hypothetical protein [Actinomycetota bacterium]